MAKHVSIIGTGDFARALGRRLLSHGYSLTFGSRSPKARDLAAIDDVFNNNTDVTTISDAIAACDVIFMCIHAANHASVLRPFADAFAGKCVVDVSNVESKRSDDSLSQAERLQQVLPEANIVKAFNTQSAYKLASSSSGEGSVVFAASDSQDARDQVLAIARTCGFVGVDSGALSASRDLEAMPLNLCGDWLVPLGIFFVTFGIWVFWIVYKMGISKGAWDRLPSKGLNEAYGAETITLLGFTYLPGGIAGFVQIYNGTKYKRFPTWLDLWLKARKQLGLLALLLCCMHCIVSVAIMNTRNTGDLYESTGFTVKANQTDDIYYYYDSILSLKGELLIFTGVIATALMAILGITSIPAVGNLLTWRQWVFVQSYTGFVMLCFAESHVMVKGLKSWMGASVGDLCTSMTFTSSIIPWLAILLRVLLWLPGINGYLWKIRGGWERVSHQTDDIETGGVKSTSFNKIGVQVQGEVAYDNKSMDEFELKANGHKA